MATKLTIDGIGDLTGEQIAKMSKSELYEVLEYGSPIAKRIRKQTMRELKERGIQTTPSAYKKRFNPTLKKYGYDSYKDYDFKYNQEMSSNEMRFRVAQLRNFFRSGTRNVKSWEEHMIEFAKRLSSKSGVTLKSATKIGSKNYTRLWRVYNRLVEVEKRQKLDKYESGTFQKLIYDTLVGRKRVKKGELTEDQYIEELVRVVTEKTEADYVTRKKREESDDGGSGFDFGGNF